ncbi:unnamed protein product [Caenorhabditis bovis]|uniref:protein-tyrosine-phosphatase n=1 Tax=Caenorhabditis bovis TaxID=2654633 RepID=A0A8S1ESH7_9PELO|nr:unnamed protein product [Caenorhabditis bovis]
MRIHCWIWWITVILLFLRYCRADADDDTDEELLDKKEIRIENTTNAGKTTTTKPEPKLKDARDLEIPRCESNHDCVHGGVCKKGNIGYGICMCPASCPATIPVRCGYRFSSASQCLLMDKIYRSKYDVLDPACYHNQCVCPPQFDEVQVAATDLPLRLNTTLPPIKCDKRDLQVVGNAFPSPSVYKGSDVTLFCCINVDPEGFVDAAGVFFIQNSTLMREATAHPFNEEYRRRSQGRHACWELEIKNAQPSDTGSYMCMVTSSVPGATANYTIDFEVKDHHRRSHSYWYKRPKKVTKPTDSVSSSEFGMKPPNKTPRMIHKLRVNATEKEAVITWESEEGPEGSQVVPIDLRLVRRTDNRGHVVFSQDNATSPVIVKELRAATPYTLFVSGKDGTVPFEFTEHFSTKQKRPHAPKEEDVRVLNSGSSLICEVEWKSPAETNGRIVKYFVSVRGALRIPRPDGSLIPDDFPMASEADKRCANWDGDESKAGQSGINPIDFSTDFYSCKFGPLKPNRNYSVSVWAENSAGRSLPAVFKKSCVTNYAQPDVVHEPQTSLAANQSTFSLKFGAAPDDTNGPISCYYVAIVPIPKNVSLDLLPPTNEIVMDSFSKVFSNNLHGSAAEKKRFFAYIAESYTEFPRETIIGDGGGVADMQPCNVQYLSRYSAEDLALRTGLKYTGFLIVRVDKEEEKKFDKSNPIGGSRFLQRILDRDRSANPTKRVSLMRKQRQLHLSGPAYGFSGYFKPVILDPEASSGGFATVLKVVVPLVIFIAMATLFAMAIVNRHRRGRGHPYHWCPLSRIISKDVADRTLLKPSFGAVLIEDLPTEYVMRHRDSDFVFVQEYEALPHYQFETTASNRKDNLHKNRYNDIRAFDETRVKLSKIDGDDSSDYINANYIKSWNGLKTFIAAQAPLDATLGDFWRMIWEQEAYLIVMVANLSEKNRQQCAKYWPDDSVQRYGDIVVKPVQAFYFSDYAVRTFDIVHVDEAINDGNPMIEYANIPMIRNSGAFGANARRVTQYHFMNWNDYKAPECSTSMLRFLHILRDVPEFNDSPVVIHCSAGVGRTGTFITIDSMFDQCNAEGKANVFEFVSSLRRQRNLMVQSVEQYVFIYKALAEWHLYGYTDMDIDQFEEHYQMLLEPSMRERSASFNGSQRVMLGKSTDKSCENGLEEEFKRLERNLEVPPSTSFASKDENLMKNRFEAAVPYDKYRVVLSPTIGYADSSYINASHIKGYFYSYIVAQDPVSEVTVFDFWRMIADQRISTVVMLSNEADWSASEKYWPEEVGKTATFRAPRNNVDVEFIDEERQPDYLTRTLAYSMKDNEGGQKQEIVQYAFTSWPSEAPVPTSSTSLLSLISRVLERQSRLADSGPILVHCRNGSSETGIFVCISLLLLRLKAERRIDVFQTVKGLQNQRPMMFTKLEQYSFCYQSVADYISRTSTR